MPFNLDCPCPEQVEYHDFDADVTVDRTGTVIDSSIPALINTAFNKDEVQRLLNDEAYAFWKQTARSIRCPKPCREVISGSFEAVPPNVFEIRGGPLNPAPGVPPIIRTTYMWVFTERLKIIVKCITE